MDMPLWFSVAEEPGSMGLQAAAGRDGVAFQTFPKSIFVTQGRTGMNTGHISDI